MTDPTRRAPGIRELVDRTPQRRVRHIDLLRAVAITAVVLGHWLVIVVEYDNGGQLTGFSALRALGWAHPVSWLFQVMPVFFMVGGYANAASLTAYQAGGGHPAGWLLDRSARLVRPTTVLLVLLGLAALAARLLGADSEQIGTAVWLASMPLWFLVVYLGMIAFTPLMYALHRRAGLLVPALLLVPVLAGDVLRIRFADDTWAYGSFLFGWLAIHQIGFCWRDGRLPTGPRVFVPLLAGGLAALWLLTYAGPYPVSMVSVPGATLQNSSPPSLAMVALACAQLGLALLLAGPSERWLRRRGPWTVVVAANAVILTLFLWHMVAAILATLGLHAAGLLPTPAVDSADWLLWQIPWVAILVVVLAGLVAVFGRIESRAARVIGSSGRVVVPAPVLAALGQPRRLVMIAVAGYAAVIIGLLWQAVGGYADHGPFALPTGALLLYLAGAGALRAARTIHYQRSSPRP